LTIETANQQGNNATIYVYDVTGTLIKKAEMKENNMNLDVSSLSSGIYELRYINGNNNIVTKFTKY